MPTYLQQTTNIQNKMKHVKRTIILGSTLVLLGACDARVNTAPPVTEKNTTIINPPAQVEKKVENNTTVINPPAKEETKTTTTTTRDK